MSEEAILKWYNEAHLAKGKSVFLVQMKKFVEWLKNAEEGKPFNVLLFCVSEFRFCALSFILHVCCASLTLTGVFFLSRVRIRGRRGRLRPLAMTTMLICVITLTRWSRKICYAGLFLKVFFFGVGVSAPYLFLSS